MLTKRSGITCLLSLVPALICLSSQQSYAAGTLATLGFDSRYISEGRDNTAENSLHHIAASQNLGNLTAGLWYARSSFEDYREFNFSLNHEAELGEFTLSSTYTYLDFSTSDPEDHELGLHLNSGDMWLLQINLGAYYSYRSKGTYLIGEVNKNFALSERFSLTPYLSLGANYGYVVEEHRGVDHWGAGVLGEFALSESFFLGLYISAIEPISKNPEESLVSATWAGVSLTYAF